MDTLFSFISRQCEKYGIDESHGLKHAKGTLIRANEILKSFTDVHEKERKITLYAAALHDTCDSKYTPLEQSVHEVSYFLRSQGWPLDEITALVRIITTMSYSKLKKSMHLEHKVYPNHGKWQRAYHVARHADLLEGYIVARCVLYNQHIFPGKSEEEHWQRALDLFSERVFTYIPEGWLFLPGALEMAATLEQEAIRCLKQRSMDWPEPDISEIKN